MTSPAAARSTTSQTTLADGAPSAPDTSAARSNRSPAFPNTGSKRAFRSRRGASGASATDSARGGAAGDAPQRNVQRAEGEGVGRQLVRIPGAERAGEQADRHAPPRGEG